MENPREAINYGSILVTKLYEKLCQRLLHKQIIAYLEKEK